MDDSGILASYLLSALSVITNFEHTSQYKLVKDLNSKRVNDLLINKTIPVTLHQSLLRFSDKVFEIQGDLLKKITKKNYYVDPAKLPDKKFRNDFANELCFDEKALSKKTDRDKSPMRKIKSHAIMACAISTRFLSSNLNELCDRLKSLVQKKQAGNNFIIFNPKIIAIADKPLENKCISTKQHKV